MSHARIALLLSCWAGGALCQVAPEKPAEDPVAAARAKNLEAYAQRYTPQRARMMKEARGRWVAIVAGAVLPADPDGNVEPAATWQAVDARARKLHPEAAHRFLFRVGEDGDAEHFYTMAEWDHGIGSGLVEAVSKATRSGWWCAGSNVWLRPKGGGGDVIISCKGPNDCPYARFSIRAPRGEEHVTRVMGFASAFRGPAVVSQKTAQALGLAQWEIPGTLLLNGHAECRRSRARFALEAPDVEVTVDVAIWPARTR